MSVTSNQTENIFVRLAENSEEIEAAQHLRYLVFYEENGAQASEEVLRLKRDFDAFDDVTDHLVVIDSSVGEGAAGIVGTYRLLPSNAADKFGRFYTSDEYDIAPLLNCGASLLELGRSCVLAPYRTRPVLQLLWQGIAEYVLEREIGLMFGCASLHGTDTGKLSEALAYMYHYHLAPEELRPQAIESRYVDMNLHVREYLNVREIFASLPPLIKGYLRLGATIGDGAVIDYQFNTTDVCIVLQTHLVTSRYRKHYERTTQMDVPAGDNPELKRESA